jgi:integrase
MMKRDLPKYAYRDVDRYGRSRHYFKPPRGSKIRLPDDATSEEFHAAYAAAIATISVAPPPPQRTVTPPKQKTLRWLCIEYMSSRTFKRLDPRTQYVRRGILERCMLEPVRPDAKEIFADYPLAFFTAKSVKVLRDRKDEFPESANGRVKALRQVFAWAIEDEIDDVVTFNPARDVSYLKSASEGFHSWTIAEVELFEAAHPIGSSARLAFALLLYTGQRRSDIIRFGRQHVRHEWLRFTQFKNRNRKPVTLEIPLVPELRRIIDASQCGDLTFLVTAFGSPFTANGFGNRMRKWCDEAGLEGCSAHGLRKAATARLAEIGCTDAEIMSITGHTTRKEIDRYTKGVRQRHLAENVLVRMNKTSK